MIEESQQMLTAIAACIIARQIHRAHEKSMKTTMKPDGSPVTVADVEAENRMREIILTAWPDDGFVGEESGFMPGTSGFTWVVDPLDGTLQYVAGMDSDYGPLLARTDADGIELGMVFDSKSATFWRAERGKGASRSVVYDYGILERRIRVDASPVPTRIADAIVCFGHLSRMDGAGMDIGMLVARFKTHLPVSRFRMFMHVAEGQLDAVVARLEHDWDLFANQIIVEEAGGTVILLPLKNGRWVVAARSRELAEEAVENIKRSIR